MGAQMIQWLIVSVLMLSSMQLYAAPAGQYQRSCKECQVEGERFCCRCKDRYGDWRKSCIDGRCQQASLMDGQLRCRRAQKDWPRGPYHRRCLGCEVKGNQFCCTCNDRHGDWLRSCTDRRCQRVFNRSGRLWCAKPLPGWPTGSYRYRSRQCAGCHTKDGKFCCTCLFETARGRNLAIKSCVPSQCKRASARFGYLRCQKRPASWPKGWYYRKCAGCQAKGDKLCCTCQQPDGATQVSCVPKTCKQVKVVYGFMQCATRPKNWPKGRFYRRCVNCSTKGAGFCCYCRNDEQDVHHTCIAKECKRAYVNDGHLRCSKKPKGWPRGPYRLFCAGCLQTKGRFCCSCKYKDFWRRSCVQSGCSRVSSLRGYLRCGKPLPNWPKGNYRSRCVSCVAKGASFCCTCRGVDGWQRTCIDKRCKQASTLRGYLHCRQPLKSWPKGPYQTKCHSCFQRGKHFCCRCKFRDDLGRHPFRSSCITSTCKRVSTKQGLLQCQKR